MTKSEPSGRESPIGPEPSGRKSPIGPEPSGRESIDALLILPPYASATAADYYPAPYFLASFLRQRGYTATVLDLNRRLPALLLEPRVLRALARRYGARKRALEHRRRLSDAELAEYRTLVSRVGRLTALRRSRAALLASMRPTGRMRVADRPFAATLGGLGEDICLGGETSRRLAHALLTGGPLEGLSSRAARAAARQFLDVVRPDLDRALGSRPRLIGLSVPFGMQLLPALAIARYCRRAQPAAHLCLGGPVLTSLGGAAHGRLVSSGLVDSVVVNEGEAPLERLARALRQDRPEARAELTTPPAAVEVALRPGTTCLRIPVPARAARDDLLWMPVLQSRGCYWGRCTFCSYGCQYASTRYRHRPSEDVLDDIAHYRAQGIRSFVLVVESLPPKHALELATGILRRRFDIEWGCFIRVDPHFTVSTLRTLKDSGFVTACLGMESSHDRILRLMNKGYDAAALRRFFDRVREAELRLAQVNVIFDFPTTTFAETMAVLEFCREHRDLTKSFSIHSFVLDDNSEVGHRPERYGITVHRDRLPRRWNQECNAVAYEDPAGMTEAEKDEAFRRFWELDRETRARHRFCSSGDELAWALADPRRSELPPGAVRFGPRTAFALEPVCFGSDGRRLDPPASALVSVADDGWHAVRPAEAALLGRLAGRTVTMDELVRRLAVGRGPLGTSAGARRLLGALARRGLVSPAPPQRG
jgi:hypothetical protein